MRDAPYSLAVRAAPGPYVLPSKVSNGPGKNSRRGPKPRQTTALMTIRVLNFIVILLSNE
jgi:hypothetical protein